MPYVFTQDLVDRIGEDALYVLADRDRDGTLDNSAVIDAADDASAEIDTYLSVRYSVPLYPVPRVIQRLAVDITIYRLADAAGGYTEERRKRYDDAIALLRRIASGEARLGIDDAAENAAEKPAVIRGDAITDDANPPRLFGRRQKNGWLL